MSSAQYSMKDLDVSNDTDDSFGGACPPPVPLRPLSSRASRCAAIAKRVLGLLAVGIIGGVVLFKLGLSTLR